MTTKPKFIIPQVQRVMTLLADGEWHKAEEIKKYAVVDPRVVRIIAEKTGQLIGGAQGYKRTDMADPEEIWHARNSLRSRARKLLKRAKRLEKEFRRGLVEMPQDQEAA